MTDSIEPCSEAELRRILAMITVVVFFAVASGSMINVALPYVGHHFGVSEGTYGWVVTGFSMTFAIFSAIHGRLADVVGIRRLYLAGVFAFGLVSVLVAMAPTIEILIALRWIQGIGAAAMPALGTTLVAKTFPAHRRGMAMGVLLGTVGVSASIGPFLGGALVQFVSWRWVFGVVGLVLGVVPFGLVWLPKGLDRPTGERFDGIGAVLLGVSVAGFMLGFVVLERFGVGLEWMRLMGGSGAILGSYVWWIHHHDNPFTPPVLFRNVHYLANLAVAFLTSATRMGSLVLVPIVLTNIDNLSPLVVGLVLLPGAVLIALLSPMAGRLSDRMGARVPVFVGAVGILLGNLVTAAYVGSGPVGVAVGMTLYGLGFAFTQSPMLGANSRILPASLVGVGMGVFMMIFFLGSAVGVALTVTVVELQGVDAPSWIGLSLGAGARYSNAMLTLTAAGALAIGVCPWLAARRDEVVEGVG